MFLDFRQMNLTVGPSLIEPVALSVSHYITEKNLKTVLINL